MDAQADAVSLDAKFVPTAPPDHQPAPAGRPAARARRPHDLPLGLIAAIFAVCFALVAIPVLTHPLPPFADYVNHLARMHVIAALPHDGDLSRFYHLSWSILPNLMMDVVVPPMVRFVSVYRAGEIYTLMCFALIVGGTLTLHRALFGRWSAVPLLVFPLLYNQVLLIGVMNYYFGIGLSLFALSAWVMLRDKPWPWRYGVSTLFVVVLFFCHLVAAGIYGIGILAFELSRLWERRAEPLLPRLAEFCAGGLPFLAVVPLLLASPTWGLSGQNHWEPQGKIEGIEWVISVYYDNVAFALTAIVVAAGLWAARHKLVAAHALLVPLLMVGGAVYLAMPREAFATYMADQRLPVAIAFMVLACISIDLRGRLVQRSFVILLLLLLAVRVTEVQTVWDRLSRWSTDFSRSVELIKPGSRVLVAYADVTGGEDVRDLGLVHAACLAMIEKSSLVSTAFTVKGKQILRVNKPYADWVDTEDGEPPQVEQLLVAEDAEGYEEDHYWNGWPDHFDYVYVLFTERDAPDPDPDRLKLAFEGARFQLYQVVHPKDGPDGTPAPAPAG